MKPVLIIRGLNSYGQDRLNLGPFAYSEVYGPWLKEMKSRGRPGIPLYGLGAGTMKSSYHTALARIHSEILGAKVDRFHILTHSSGGLIGRRLSHEPELKNRIISLSTICCPHQGTELAMSAERIAKQPFKRWLLKTFGYNLEKRLDLFRELSPNELKEFNKFYPPLKSIPTLNFVSSLPPGQRAWPFRILSILLGQPPNLTGDGLLTEESQLWGHIKSLQLDHLSSLGFFLHIGPRNRKLAQREYQRVFDYLESFWLQTEARL